MILRLTLGRSLYIKLFFHYFMHHQIFYQKFLGISVLLKRASLIEILLIKCYWKVFFLFFLFYDNDFCSCTNLVSNLLEKSLVWNYFTIIEIYTWCVQIEGAKIEPRGSLFKFEFTTWSCYYKNPYFRHNWALEVSYGCLKAIRWD